MTTSHLQVPILAFRSARQSLSQGPTRSKLTGRRAPPAIVPHLLADGEFVCKRVVHVGPVQARFVFPRRGFDELTEPKQSLVELIRKVAEARCKLEAPAAKEEEEEVALALVEESVTPMEEVLS